MVIHQFNRLIKNKWVWGVFAIAISIFFAFDFIFTGGDNEGRSNGSVGTLGGKDISHTRFQTLVNDARGFGRNRDSKSSNVEINRRAWKAAAALQVAKAAHLDASDDEVRQQVLREFTRGTEGFNSSMYAAVLRENGLTPEMYEDFLRRQLTLNKLSRVVLGSASWVSPAELEGAINDWTDKFTVRVASFMDKDFGKVKLDDKTLEAYYKDNTNSIALPDLVTVKYVKFMADTPDRLKQFKIAAEEVSNHWDVVQVEPRFQVKKGSGTNVVTETMSLEKAWPMVERDIQIVTSVEAYRTNLLFRAYPQDAKEAADNKVDRLEKIAAEEKAKVEVSRPFSLDNSGFVKGFMVRANQIAPGCEGFAAAVSELDPDSPDLRYGVVAGTNCVYLIERASFVKAHVPTLAEAKDHIREDALRDAQAKAFKASVEKSRALLAADLAKGKPFDAKLLAGASVTTSIVFSASSIQHNSFADSMYVATSTMKLQKGQLSDFITTANPRRGLVVYVENREPGDAAQAQIVRSQLRDELSRGSMMKMSDTWSQWNLDRLGFLSTAAESSVAEADEVVDSEE